MLLAWLGDIWCILPCRLKPMLGWLDGTVRCLFELLRRQLVFAYGTLVNSGTVACSQQIWLLLPVVLRACLKILVSKVVREVKFAKVNVVTCSKDISELYVTEEHDL